MPNRRRRWTASQRTRRAVTGTKPNAPGQTRRSQAWAQARPHAAWIPAQGGTVIRRRSSHGLLSISAISLVSGIYTLPGIFCPGLSGAAERATQQGRSRLHRGTRCDQRGRQRRSSRLPHHLGSCTSSPSAARIAAATHGDSGVSATKWTNRSPLHSTANAEGARDAPKSRPSSPGARPSRPRNSRATWDAGRHCSGSPCANSRTQKRRLNNR